MSDEVENLLTPIHDFVERLKSEASNSTMKDKREQLKAVSRSIEQHFEAKGVPVPEELRRLKISLMSETEQAEKATHDLGELQKGLQDILRGIDKHNDSEISTSRRGSKGGAKRRRVGEQTPATYYKPLIVEYLKSKGGSARASDVVKWIQDRMEGKLRPGDFQLRSGGGGTVWQNNVHWARQTLVKEGILKNDSPYGFWEIK
jgi:hypothetical protein